MEIELLTKEDLRVFKKELLSEIKELLVYSGAENKEWLKASEVRRLLKISPGTLLTLRVTAKLKFSKIGGTYYYHQDDIKKMLDNGLNGNNE